MRNPYDRVVSWFWMHMHDSLREELSNQDFSATKKMFQTFTLIKPQLPEDRSVFTIKDKPCFDTYVRYENLDADLVRLSEQLKLEKPLVLGKYKSKSRLFPEHDFRSYYDQRSANVVFKNYKSDFDLFEYEQDSWSS